MDRKTAVTYHITPVGTNADNIYAGVEGMRSVDGLPDLSVGACERCHPDYDLASGPEPEEAEFDSVPDTKAREDFYELLMQETQRHLRSLIQSNGDRLMYAWEGKELSQTMGSNRRARADSPFPLVFAKLATARA